MLNKKEEFERLKHFQREQLESINKDDLDEHDMIESPMENQMREVRLEGKVIDHIEKDIEKLEKVEQIPAREEVQPWALVRTDRQNFLVFLPEQKIEL